MYYGGGVWPISENNVALILQPTGVARAVYTALGSLPQLRRGRTTQTTDTAQKRSQPSTSAAKN